MNSMLRSVLDASALLALIHQEPGNAEVAQAMEDGAAISSVNLSEVVSKLSELGTPETFIRDTVDRLGQKISVVDFNADFAYKAGLLRSVTKQLGLSLGDRACLVLAQHLNVPVLTADRVWKRLSLGIDIQIIR